MKPVVHVVDDDPGFRNSLRSLLEADGLAVETYADAADFLGRHRHEQPGCLLVDVRMPGMSGLQLQEEMQRRDLRVPVIFLTAHGDIAMAVAAVRRGALDFLEKPFDDEALLRLVRRAIEIDADERERSEHEKRAGARIGSLSARELEVLERVLEGKRNSAIADELGVSVKTIEFHRKRLMAKLEVKNVVELVNFVVRHRATSRAG